MKKIFGMMLFASALLLTGCQKDNVEANNDLQKKGVVNPFASVGVAHNNFLMDLGYEFEDLLNSDKPLDSVEAEALIDGFLNYTKGELSEYAMPMGLNVDDFVDESFVAFCDFFDEYDDDSMLESLLEESKDMSNLLANVRDLEADIILNMQTHQDSASLMSLTIFEYSLMFWDDAYTNAQNPWHSVMQSLQSQFDSKGSLSLLKKIRKWWNANKNRIVGSVLTGGYFDYKAAEAIIEVFPEVLSQPWILGAIIGLGSAAGVVVAWLGID